MASKSKADILKRYLSSSTSEANELLKKKKRKKKPAILTGGVRVVEEEEWGIGARRDNDSEDEGEGPLVVDDKGDQVASLQRQKQQEEQERKRSLQQETADSSPARRRQRHDSPDASPPRRKRQASPDASPPRRKRHDSPDNSPPRRRQHASPDASPPRRKRHDSPDASPPRRRKGHDASSPPQRRRNASPDTSPPRRKRHDSQPGTDHEAAAEKKVGLKTGAEFRQEMEAKKAETSKLWQGMEADFSGENAETVVRDRRGRKLEMLSEFMNQEAFREGKLAKQAKEEYEWGRGKVQKAKDDEFKKELEDIKNAPFARYESDPALERMRKAEIRPDDPMAEYMIKKINKQKAASGQPLKPEYKGPPARPNRFNIRPGYRWDGIDRSNGFEGRWFKRQAELRTQTDNQRAWSMADL